MTKTEAVLSKELGKLIRNKLYIPGEGTSLARLRNKIGGEIGHGKPGPDCYWLRITPKEFWIRKARQALDEMRAAGTFLNINEQPAQVNKQGHRWTFFEFQGVEYVVTQLPEDGGVNVKSADEKKDYGEFFNIDGFKHYINVQKKNEANDEAALKSFVDNLTDTQTAAKCTLMEYTLDFLAWAALADPPDTAKTLTESGVSPERAKTICCYGVTQAWAAHCVHSPANKRALLLWLDKHHAKYQAIRGTMSLVASMPTVARFNESEGYDG